MPKCSGCEHARKIRGRGKYQCKNKKWIFFLKVVRAGHCCLKFRKNVHRRKGM